MAKNSPKRIYDSETGEVSMDGEELAPIAYMEPLRVPHIVQQFIAEFIPAPSEKDATDVLSFGELRCRLSCYVAFGSKEDVLQDYLDELSSNGYVIQPTSSGPAMCLIRRDAPQVLNGYDAAEEVQ